MTKRIEWIDALKGFATLLVVLGHCIDGYKTAYLFPKYQDIFVSLYAFIYSFHMPLFFLVSGYLFHLAYNNVSQKKFFFKVLDIVLLYFIFSTAQILVQILMQGKINRTVDFVDILRLPVYALPPYWYLYVLAALYVIFYFIVKKPHLIKLGLCFCVSCLSLFYAWSGAFQLASILYYSVFFEIGGILSFSRLEFKRPLLCVLGLLALACIGFYINIRISKAIIAMTLSLAVVISFIKCKALSDNKLFLLCGKYCLPIYLVHCYFTAGTRVVLKALCIKSVSPYLVSGMVLGVFAPIVIYEVCSRIHFLEFVFKPANVLQRILARKL